MWKREGVPILEKHRHSFSERNQTLHISNITSSEYGTYSCIASNAYGESEKHTYITGNGTRDETQSDQTVLSSGLTLTCVLGLCLVFYCLYKYHHSDVDNAHGIYQTSLSRERAVRPPLQRNTLRSLVTLRLDPQTGKKPLFCFGSLMIRPQHVLKLERTNYILQNYIK
ncbi:HEPACAM family member 2-like isoform X2 [Carassius carassius]|uniref:HEPACAM family member 2-like isoform X2 n=1 Tax=Carassius carassius TaxID=217509 RepID=UPI002868BFB3|nr:HEPACAM family member 2-like isoform X2 [Carassius carassius]